MKRATVAAVVLAVMSAACSSSSAVNCVEYASEVRFQMEHAKTPDDVMKWLKTTSEHAAKLIQADPNQAQLCAEAIIEATFSAGFADLEAELESLLDQ